LTFVVHDKDAPFGMTFGVRNDASLWGAGRGQVTHRHAREGASLGRHVPCAVL